MAPDKKQGEFPLQDMQGHEADGGRIRIERRSNKIQNPDNQGAQEKVDHKMFHGTEGPGCPGRAKPQDQSVTGCIR